MNSSNDPTGIGPAPSAQMLGFVSDALAWPLLLLRGDGTLIHANLAARQMLAERRLLTLLANGCVQAADSGRRSDLQAALTAALQATAGDPLPLLQWALPSGRISVSVKALRAAADEQPVLLLALSPEQGRLADLHAYAAMHALSDAETRVLLHLARGDSSGKAAA